MPSRDAPTLRQGRRGNSRETLILYGRLGAAHRAVGQSPTRVARLRGGLRRAVAWHTNPARQEDRDTVRDRKARPRLRIRGHPVGGAPAKICCRGHACIRR